MDKEKIEKIIDTVVDQVIKERPNKSQNLKEFVTNKQAIALKDFGYNVPAYGKFLKGKFQFNSLGSPTNFNDGSFGKNIISAPQYSQVFEWLRVTHDLVVLPDRTVDAEGLYYFFVVYKKNSPNCCEGSFDYHFSQSMALDKAIEMLKKK